MTKIKAMMISIDGATARSGKVKILFFFRKIESGVSRFLILNLVSTEDAKVSFYSFSLFLQFSKSDAQYELVQFFSAI